MREKAFTLIEILVVITVIGVLFGTVVISYSSLTRSSRDAKRKSDLEQIRSALELYRSNDALAEYPVSSNCTNLASLITTYLPNFPSDPKASVYSYGCLSSSSDYTIGSHLETTTVTCTSLGSCTGGCNYCIGPYGQKP